MFKKLLGIQSKIDCELECKRSEFKAMTSHMKTTSYFFDSDQEKLEFLGWGDFCLICKEHEPFMHTHNFIEIKDINCIKCGGHKVSQTCQLFGTVMDPRKLIWTIGTGIFCKECGHKFNHCYKFEPSKQIIKKNEFKSVF